MKLNNLTSIAPNTARAFAFALTLSVVPAMAGTPFSKIVTFGDSLSDTGNASLLTGGLFPASPPNYDGRISDGPLWVEHLAEELDMELLPGNQYAVAGARTDSGNFNANLGLVALANTGLQSQVAGYLQDAAPGGADPDALHTIWIGANDIFTMLYFGGDPRIVVASAVQNTVQAVVTLGHRGARHILVVNLPDLGLTPLGRSLGQSGSAQLSSLTDGYNAALKGALDSLEPLGIRTIRLDAADLIRDIAANPAAFGLVNATDPALATGGDPAHFLFWNDVHPTSAGHRAVAERAVNDLVEFYSPRRGRGHGAGLVRSLNGLVRAPGR